jgi:cysteine desulfurase/selenocysteine lyase
MSEQSLLPQRTDEFPLFADHTYLNTASEGLLPNRTAAALQAAAIRAQRGSTAAAEPLLPAERVRLQLSRLFSSTTDDFTFTSSTTHGVNIALRGLLWQPGDNVVLPADEFPSLARAVVQLRDSGVQIRVVPRTADGRVSVDALLAAVDQRTRAVVCSAVSWDIGALVDLAALGRGCRQAGVLSIVDGVQAVGAVALDLPALDLSVLAFHGYKWLTAGWGQGGLYVAPAAVAQILPRFVGEQSFIGADPYDSGAAYHPGARRYGVGGANRLGLTALEQGLTLIEELGIEAIAAHNRALGTRLIRGLHDLGRCQVVSPLAATERAGIVVFTAGSVARDQQIAEQLQAAEISLAQRPRGLRAAMHYYNSAADVDRLLNVLEAL